MLLLWRGVQQQYVCCSLVAILCYCRSKWLEPLEQACNSRQLFSCCSEFRWRHSWMKTSQMMTSCTGRLHPAVVQSDAALLWMWLNMCAPEHTAGDVDGLHLYRNTLGLLDCSFLLPVQKKSAASGFTQQNRLRTRIPFSSGCRNNTCCFSTWPQFEIIIVISAPCLYQNEFLFSCQRAADEACFWMFSHIQDWRPSLLCSCLCQH